MKLNPEKTIEQMLAQVGGIAYSRSSVLVPLHWTLGMLLVSLLVLVIFHSAAWILVCVVGALGVVLLTTLFFYVYFGFTEPTHLRSETHSLMKMAMEKGYFGDSDNSFVEMNMTLPEIGDSTKLQLGTSSKETQ